MTTTNLSYKRPKFLPEGTDAVVKGLWRSALDFGMGEIFKRAVAVRKYHLESFTESFLQSETFERYFVDSPVYTQSPLYVLQLFEEEGVTVEKEEPSVEKIEAAEWMGHLFAEWAQRYEATGPEILRQCDIPYVIQSYDILHTQSLGYAIQCIIEECSNIKQTI